jgi:hypothetical protein
MLVALSFATRYIRKAHQTLETMLNVERERTKGQTMLNVERERTKGQTMRLKHHTEN